MAMQTPLPPPMAAQQCDLFSSPLLCLFYLLVTGAVPAQVSSVRGSHKEANASQTDSHSISSAHYSQTSSVSTGALQPVCFGHSIHVMTRHLLQAPTHESFQPTAAGISGAPPAAIATSKDPENEEDEDEDDDDTPSEDTPRCAPAGGCCMTLQLRPGPPPCMHCAHMYPCCHGRKQAALVCLCNSR